jgi:16S rRNA (cytidine1402-2'-O)-methyltransferase
MPRQRGGKSTSPRTDATRDLLRQRTRNRTETPAQPSDSVAPSKPVSGGDSLWVPQAEDAGRLAPGLHIVATPIGNLQDISLRALDTLRRADLIACEDTLVSAKLLFRYGLKTPLLPYHEHNAEAIRPRLMARLGEGGAVALISDAGTPLVSDPGYKLVREAIAAGHALHVVPGASAALAALVLSGLPPDRFFFAGFLDAKSVARRRDLEGMAAIPATLIFYESGPRLAASLADMAAMLGDRPAVVARELTKLHEEIRRASLSELAAYYAEAGPPKGEIVVLVGPALPAAAVTEDDLDATLRAAMAGSSLKEAVATVAMQLGLTRRRVYQRALDLAAEAGSEADSA